jgi:hypothetical protein
VLAGVGTVHRSEKLINDNESNLFEMDVLIYTSVRDYYASARDHIYKRQLPYYLQASVLLVGISLYAHLAEASSASARFRSCDSSSLESRNDAVVEYSWTES